MPAPSRSRSRPPISRSNLWRRWWGGGKPADARFRNVAVVEGSLRILGVVAVAVNRAVRVAAGQDRKVLLFTVHLRLERSTTAVRVL